MISIGKPSITLEEVRERITDFDVLRHYFNINTVPCVINSPFRMDNNPSLGFYTKDGNEILWTDFSTKEGGNIIVLLGKYWGESYMEALQHLWEDLPNITNTNCNNIKVNYKNKVITKSGDIKLECKIREWRDYDIEYWKSFGISLEWLKYAEIYPISHKIVIKNGTRMVFGCDKLAYAYVEHKEGKVTLKIYQPMNKRGFKWSNNHDRSVISLWTKVPEYGDKICICSSMKDALCLWANTGIPALSIQGEGYGISDTAINELKRRYKKVYILLDNDEVGLSDGLKLSESTGFINIVLPQFEGGKDISDYYKSLQDPIKFKEQTTELFN